MQAESFVGFIGAFLEDGYRFLGAGVLNNYWWAWYGFSMRLSLVVEAPMNRVQETL